MFSISEVRDADGKPVLHERLLLPFSDDGGAVNQVLASLKSISIEGKFRNELLLARSQKRSYLVQAVISAHAKPTGNTLATWS